MPGRTAGPTRALALQPRRRPWAAALLSGALLAGCADRADRVEQSGEEARYGGTVVAAFSVDLQHANPLVASEDRTQEVNRFLLFMPLIRHDEGLEYEPYLAESWELEEDGVVFRLRDDVRWHDGVPTTAYDVAFTYERAKDPELGSPLAQYFERWTGVEVVDSFTVRFAFEPHLDPLSGLPFAPIAPKHLLEGVPSAEMRRTEFNKNPVGNGPFRFVSARANDRWIFEANPEFPEDLGGRPYVDRLVYRVIPEAGAEVAELIAGSADIIDIPPPEQMKDLDARPEIRTIVRPMRRFTFVGWNGRRPPLDDPRVRRALAMTIDRRSVVEGLRQGFAEIGTGPVGSFHWAYNEEVEPLPYDTSRARALLAEAGYRDVDGDGILEGPDGRDLAFELQFNATERISQDLAELMQSNMAAIGVRMTQRPLEFTTIIENISTPTRNFDAVVMAWASDFRADLRPMFHSAEIQGPFQMASYSNPEVDRLLDGLGQVSSREQALPLYHRLQEILVEEQPWSVIDYALDLVAARERVRNLDMDIRGFFVNAQRWWLADAPAAAES